MLQWRKHLAICIIVLKHSSFEDLKWSVNEMKFALLISYTCSLLAQKPAFIEHLLMYTHDHHTGTKLESLKEKGQNTKIVKI